MEKYGGADSRKQQVKQGWRKAISSVGSSGSRMKLMKPLWMITSSYFITPPMKPRPVSQLVAQQVTQQFASPTQPKKEKKDKTDKEKNEKEPTIKKNSHKKMRPRLKNVDRSSAQHLEVTVGDLTVIITDFKEKAKATPTSSTASADQHNQSGSSSDNTERGISRSSSPRGEVSSVNGESH
ncbi:hypothetical protein JZ751_005841 [Albula glossodonta]|uniref:YY1-associated factor 2 n=1 Tax=Albula glossodonta TaxID=121402 RepID=A0A8T2P348_9TELE|nr:hypothetical protein JZ751_005841 [Albula glossodonta]